MKTVKIKAHELVDPKISLVSLVESGANKTPFKILKSEKPTKVTLSDKVSKFFSTDTSEISVSAYFVKSSFAQKFVTHLEETGLAESITSITKSDNDDYLTFNVSESEDSQLVAINDEVGVAITGITKGLDTYPYNVSFADQLAGSSFMPMLRMAQDALDNTIWDSMFGDNTAEESTKKVSDALKAFSKHVNGLVASLPSSVFKLEKSLSQEVPNETTKEIVKTGEIGMTNKLKEGLAGDLDGLLDATPVAKEEAAPEATPEDKTPEAKVTEGKTDDVTYEVGVLKSVEDGKFVEKKYEFTKDAEGNEVFHAFVEEDITKSDESDLDKIMKGMTVLATAIQSQNTKIEEIAKTATEASTKVGKVVTATSAGAQLDASLEAIQGDQEKVSLNKQEDNDIWAGCLPGLTTV